MSLLGITPKSKTFEEQLQQLLALCDKTEQFHKFSESGVLGFKTSLGLSHFNALPEEYPTFANIKEFARNMHKYELNLSSMEVLKYSFTILQQQLKACDTQKIDSLLEPENFLVLSNNIFKGFILKRIQQHLIPYKINLEKKLSKATKAANSAKQSQLTINALTEIDSSRMQIPHKILQAIRVGSQSLDGSVLDSALGSLDFSAMHTALATPVEPMPILDVFRAELKKIEDLLNATIPDIPEDQKELTLIAGFINACFSLFYNIGEFNIYHQELESLRDSLSKAYAMKLSINPLESRLKKLSLQRAPSPESWDCFGPVDTSKLPTVYADDSPAEWDIPDLTSSNNADSLLPLAPTFTPSLTAQSEASPSVARTSVPIIPDDAESVVMQDSRVRSNVLS